MGCPRPVSLGPLLQLKLPAGSCHPRQGSGRPWYPPVGRRQEGALRWEGGSLFQAPSSELGAWLREDGYAPGTDSPSLGDRSWVTQSRGTQWPGPGSLCRPSTFFSLAPSASTHLLRVWAVHPPFSLLDHHAPPLPPLSPVPGTYTVTGLVFGNHKLARLLEVYLSLPCGALVPPPLSKSGHSPALWPVWDCPCHWPPCILCAFHTWLPGMPWCPPGSHSWWHWVASRSTLLDVEALRTRAMYY